MLETISILGCGWLGLPLAEHLIKLGYRVKGTTSTESKLSTLRQKGIDPYYALLDPEMTISNEAFFDTDILIINIPPATFRKGADFHPKQITSLIENLKGHHIKKIFYVSSTSVYPEINAEVYEDMPLTIENDRQKALLLSERILTSANLKPTIFRCGGLMGYDRQPSIFLNKSTRSKRKKSLDTPVNYIHRDDVIEIISRLIKKECAGETFNLVAPEHPARKNFIENVKEESHSSTSFKIVSSKKIVQFLNYSFKYPDPLMFDQK